MGTLVGHEGTGAQWLLTAAAEEAVLMPRLASILQLPGPCGEQGSHSEAVSQAPECHPLQPSRRVPAAPAALKVVSMHFHRGPHLICCTR